ncbi:alpha/beta hydrolase family protein [Streptomyces sp. NPDC017056]|uniref:alpha/beta hydrolase family protein n=1 Tax=Streptomyces sp. NPDC017056 TaxID=3364973 RepID=UPI003790C4D9
MIRTRLASTALLLASALPLALVAGRAEAAPPVSATTVAAAPLAASATQLAIPRPTGPYAVGRDVRHLVDEKRRDPWVPTAERELMVSLYYPAHPDGGGESVPYMSPEEARFFLEGRRLDGVFDAGQLAATRTNARAGARPAGGKHPLLVLSPGFSLSRATLTLLSEDLASRGYVVALVDHAYESFGTAFPGGRTLTCAACRTVESEPTDAAEKKRMGKAAQDRAADISFLVDALLRRPETGRTRFWAHSAMIDPRRVGAAGHSLGGNAAAHAMSTDDRIRAGVNLDGSFFAPVPRSGLGGRPFLMLGTAAGHAPGGEDTTWPSAWRRLDGWKRWLTVKGAGHFSFLDLPVLGAQLGAGDPTVPLSGRRSGEITTSYVSAFFDRALRGAARPLLDGPSAADPEVAFHSPAQYAELTLSMEP